jgi:hypothetical protein
VVLLACAFTAIEPFLEAVFTRWDAWAGKSVTRTNLRMYLWRPTIYAFGLLLFLAFDERNTQFIYFQF